jgi:hypothetical protein
LIKLNANRLATGANKNTRGDSLTLLHKNKKRTNPELAREYKCVQSRRDDRVRSVLMVILQNEKTTADSRLKRKDEE